MSEATTLDMGISGVHIATAIGNNKPMADTELTVSAAQRKKMPSSAFGDPANKGYPIHDASHVRNAAARLEQQKGSMPATKYHQIRARIARAAKRFGIDSEYNKKTSASARTFKRGLRMTTTHPDGSRTTIHHMSAFFSEGQGDEGPRILLSMPLDKVQALSAGDENKRVWIQVAKAGRFVKDGRPFELNARTFDEICTNFVTQGFGRIQYDFEHASEMRPTEGSIPSIGTPSQGWAYGFKHDGTRLFALTEWGDLARDYIRNDQYQGVSPAIRWKQTDRVSGQPIGAVISSIAITNSPFLSGMQPLAASIGTDAAATYCAMTIEEPEDVVLSGSACCYSADEYLPRLKSALRLHDLATPTEMSEHLDRLREHMDAADGDHTKMVNGVRLQDYALPLRSIVNAHAGMNWDQVFDVVEDLINSAMDEHIVEYHDEDGADEPALNSAAPPIETPQPASNNSAEATSAASNLNTREGGPEMAATKTAEQYELEITSLTGERAGLLEQIEALKTQNLTLSTKVEEHETQMLSARVDEAFVSYKDSRKLPPNGKASMLSYLRNDPNGFEVLFPKIQAPQRHLMSVLTADGRSQNQASTQLRAQADSPNDVTPVLKPAELVARIMRERGCTLLDAQCHVDALLTKMKRATV
jgi:hypothetical protein